MRPPFSLAFNDLLPMQFDLKATGGALVIGTLFVVLFTWITGDLFAAPAFPLMGMIAGFILAGVTTGYLSEGETVVEPVVASVLVGVASYFVLDGLELKCFRNEDNFGFLMTLASMNGLALAFAGAWTGEKLQRTYEPVTEAEASFEWGWVMAGTVVGVAVSMLLANLEIRLLSTEANPYAALDPASLPVMLVVLVLGLLVTGYICAFRSPGKTPVEASVAGVITVVILLDVFVVALSGGDLLSPTILILSLLLGVASSLAGGFFGEASQSRSEDVTAQA
jgi:hypothetical protein